MIERYSRRIMADLWSRQHGYGLWLRVELAALEAMETLTIAPQGGAEAIRARFSLDLDRVSALEADLHHEVLAFLTSVSEQAGEPARFLHFGLTSSDMLDTALALQIVEALAVLDDDLAALLASLRIRALEHAGTPCLARTHGRGAEPTSFGLKLAGYFAEFSRCRQRLRQAAREIAFCKLSGVVGTYSSLTPTVEALVAKRLGLAIEPAPTQAIPRDRHAAVAAALVLLAGAIERLSIEIRHLQRQEVGEVSEGFGSLEKGSSAMPHKRNPILSENLTGLARLIRGAALPLFESMALWEERDMSHSSVERVALPDAFILADFALDRLRGVIDGLTVHPEAMGRNLDAMGGAHASQHILLDLVRAGRSRDEAYRLVQQASFDAVERRIPLHHALAETPGIADAIAPERLAELADPRTYLRHVDLILERTLQETAR